MSVAMSSLLVLSALVSGAEVAYFSLSPVQLDDLKKDKAKSSQLIIKLLEEPKKLLATILIVNNFVNITIIILSTYFTDLFLSSVTNDILKFGLQVVLVTFVILLLGEVIPKVYSAKYPVTLARIMAIPLSQLKSLFYPISKFLIMITSIVDKRIKKKDSNFSVDHLEKALELTTHDENAGPEEKKILEGIVKFGNTEVCQIMKSRVDTISFDISTDYDLLVDEIIKSGYSRIPIYQESFDNVVGILYIKDLLPHLSEGKKFNWSELLRKPFFIPEIKKIDDLLKEFQEKKIHLAVVVDEYGGTAGIVTLEDILEEIVGDITDEFDDDDLTFSKLDDKNYVFDAKIPLNDFFRVMAVDESVFEDVRGEADTLAGLILELSGKIPLKFEKLNFSDYTFTIEAADKRRIKRVKVTIREPENEQENSSSEKSNNKILGVIIVLCFSLLTTSCSNDGSGYFPKPKGYFRIDLPNKTYNTYQSPCNFTLEIPEYSTFRKSGKFSDTLCALNWKIPKFNATVHVTHHSINKDLDKFLKASKDLTYKHSVRASRIIESPIVIKESNVYALLYEIKGNSASTLQFHATDNTNHFLRGALYFNHHTNSDSLAPVVEYLKKDLIHAINTLHWQD